MVTPYRPNIETILMRMVDQQPADVCALSVADVRGVCAWAMHMERMMIPSHRHTVLDHARCQLVYELSNAGHIMWVTWHTGSKRVRATQVAAVRVRTGWQINATVAPLELTQQAMNQLLADESGATPSGKAQTSTVLHEAY